MMKLDMHLHTFEGSSDSKVTVADYIRILSDKGFQGMVITDHDSYGGYRFWKEHRWEMPDPEFVVLRGIEYDTLDAGHMLVIMPTGVDLPILEMRGLPVAALLDIVHHYGGIIGPAHPCGERYLSIFRTGIYRYRHEIAKEFDFIEGFNACEESQDSRMSALYARTYHKPATGGSDAHWEGCVGMGYTLLEETVHTETELIDYIKSRKQVTCGGSRYYGTIKDRLGKWNHLLVQSFWFYNRFGALVNLPGRRRELKRMRLADRIEG